MNKSKSFLSILIPSATVFISSGCIMILELVAGRLIARHLGSSLYTWTSVIGVVLAGITIGNYIGGRIADRFDARKSLAVLFGVASAACVATVILNNLVGKWILLWYFSWPVRVFCHVALVFLMPSTLLGMISPVIAKMALERGLPTGRTVGDIYAWGAAGSIAGTFLAGFYLIAAMGTIAIIWTIGAVLALMAIYYSVRFKPAYVWAIIYGCAVFIAVGPMNWCRTAGAALLLREKHDRQIIYEDETQYCYVTVKCLSKDPNKRVFMQDKFIYSMITMDDISSLQYYYEQIMAAVTHRFGKDKSKPCFLVIGGGGYVLPRYLEKFWPGSTVDVAEIDPGVTKAAMKAFGLEPTTAINTIPLDARNYVEELFERHQGKKYDFIYEDALNDCSVPYQLTTREFNEKLAKLLTEDGIYMVELMDIFDEGLFLGAFVNTLEQTFPFVSVIAVGNIASYDRNTFIVIGAKHKLDLNNVCADYNPNQRVWYLKDSDIAKVKGKANGMILTDDYAPVENLLVPVVCQHSRRFASQRYINRAAEFKRRGKLNKALAEYKKASELDPAKAAKAYNGMATIQIELGKLKEAAENLKKAIEMNEKNPSGRGTAALYLNLGIVLKNLNEPNQSKENLLKAIENFHNELKQDPQSASLWSKLGSTYAKIGDSNQASESFKQAVTLAPGNPANYFDLVAALESLSRYDDAIEQLNKGIHFIQEHARKNDAIRLQRLLESVKLKKLNKK